MRQVDIIADSIAEPLPDDEDITVKEEAFRVVLPGDYVEFVKQYGGGRPVVGTFMGDGHEWAIDRFLCVLKEFKEHPLGWYDIEVIQSQVGDRMWEDPDALGAAMVPIVALFAGDSVCLDYRASKNMPRTEPTVVVWLHEESKPGFPATRPVCGTFTEFLNLVT